MRNILDANMLGGESVGLGLTGSSTEFIGFRSPEADSMVFFIRVGCW